MSGVVRVVEDRRKAMLPDYYCVAHSLMDLTPISRVEHPVLFMGQKNCTIIEHILIVILVKEVAELDVYNITVSALR